MDTTKKGEKLSDLLMHSGDPKAKPEKRHVSIEICSEVNGTSIDDKLIEASKPLFYSVTWHSKSITGNLEESASILLAEKIVSFKKNVLLHLSCDKLNKEKVNAIVKKVQSLGIRNLFIIRGDGYQGDKHADFQYASDLTSYIRLSTNNYFSLGVAGYPSDYSNLEAMRHFKAKVESGADFIITQAVFHYKTYCCFVESCRDLGITIPIIPGLFIIESKSKLESFTKHCRIDVPKYIHDDLKKLKDEDVPEYGKGLLKFTIHKIVENFPDTIDFHFFTLNKLNYALNVCSDLALLN